MRKLILTTIFCLIATIARADVYYVGQWVWNSSCFDAEGCWEAPQKEFQTGVVDLRNESQAGQVGGTPQGWAIFSYSQAVTDPSLFNLSDNLDKKLNNPIISKIEQELGITLEADTVRGALIEILTLEGDPTGVNKWKPLIPSVDGNSKIHLGTEGTIYEQAFVMYETEGWELVLNTIQEDYRRLYYIEDHVRLAKQLDYWADKYGIPADDFIPDQSIYLASLPHETTITESFNTADSDTLGPDLTWTETQGDVDVASNRAIFRTQASGNTARAESDLSSSDNYAEITIISHNGSGGSDSNSTGVTCRQSSSAFTTYHHRHTRGSANTYQLYKIVTGSFTLLDDAVEVFTVNNVIGVKADGSSITGYGEGADKTSATDTAITTGTRTGFRDYMAPSATGDTVDDFESGDLAVGGGGGGGASQLILISKSYE